MLVQLSSIPILTSHNGIPKVNAKCPLSNVARNSCPGFGHGRVSCHSYFLICGPDRFPPHFQLFGLLDPTNLSFQVRPPKQQKGILGAVLSMTCRRSAFNSAVTASDAAACTHLSAAHYMSSRNMALAGSRSLGNSMWSRATNAPLHQDQDGTGAHRQHQTYRAANRDSLRQIIESKTIRQDSEPGLPNVGTYLSTAHHENDRHKHDNKTQTPPKQVTASRSS